MAVALAVPRSFAPAGPEAIVSVMVDVLPATTLPLASTTWTVKDFSVAPAVALAGADANASDVGAAGGTSLKSAPLPFAPPAEVIPYRIPAESIAKPPGGFLPSAVLKLARLRIAPLPLITSKTAPSPLVPPLTVVPKRF